MLATKPSNLSSVPGPIWCVRERKPSDIHTCAMAQTCAMTPTYIQNHFLFRKKKKMFQGAIIKIAVSLVSEAKVLQTTLNETLSNPLPGDS